MTFFVIERVPGSTKVARDASVATMSAAGYSPVAGNTIRFDEQSRTGTGWEAIRVSGMGLTPRSITTTKNQYGETPRFVRKLPRDYDFSLNLLASSLAARDATLSKLATVVDGEFLLRKYEPADGSTSLTQPHKYVRAYFVGGGNFTLGDKNTSDTDVDLLITVRAHKPDWLSGG